MTITLNYRQKNTCFGVKQVKETGWTSFRSVISFDSCAHSGVYDSFKKLKMLFGQYRAMPSNYLRTFVGSPRSYAVRCPMTFRFRLSLTSSSDGFASLFLAVNWLTSARYKRFLVALLSLRLTPVATCITPPHQLWIQSMCSSFRAVNIERC